MRPRDQPTKFGRSSAPTDATDRTDRRDRPHRQTRPTAPTRAPRACRHPRRVASRRALKVMYVPSVGMGKAWRAVASSATDSSTACQRGGGRDRYHQMHRRGVSDHPGDRAGARPHQSRPPGMRKLRKAWMQREPSRVPHYSRSLVAGGQRAPAETTTKQTRPHSAAKEL